MDLKKQFKNEELDRIRRAVKDAESKISGEIVPVFVAQSGSYQVTVYKASILLATLSFMTIIILDRYVIDPSRTIFYDPVFIFFVVVAGGAIGALLAAYTDGVKRLLMSQKEMDEFTRQRAETAFLEEEVFNTRHRTGIMIFISFLEHEVVVMADRGISKVVDQQEWDKIVRVIIEHVREGKLTEGIEAGIRRCGEILLEKGFTKTDDDINELRDDLRI